MAHQIIKSVSDARLWRTREHRITYSKKRNSLHFKPRRTRP